MIMFIVHITHAVLICAASVSAIDAIAKDVVVVGGGASGAYAAFRLREDFGKSVALVEKQDTLVSPESHSSAFIEI